MNKRLVVYTYDKVFKAYLVVVVAAKDTDHDREVPQLTVISSAADATEKNVVMDPSLIASCCSPVESRLQELAILGDGRRVDGRGSGRLRIISWKLDSEADTIVPHGSEQLDPLCHMNEGRVIIWSKEADRLIALGGDTVDEYTLSKRGCWRTTPLETSICSPSNTRSRSKQHKISPLKIRGSEAISIGKDIYMVGGYCRSPVHYTWRYRIADRRWEELASMNNKRRDFGLCSIGQYLVAVGGSSGCETLASIEVYDIEADRWRISHVTLSRPRQKLKATLSGSFLIICGGIDVNGRPLSDFEGIHVREIIQSTSSIKCFNCDLTIDGKILALSHSIDVEPSLLKLEYRSLDNGKSNGVKAAIMRLISSTENIHNTTTDKVKENKTSSEDVYNDLNQTTTTAASIEGAGSDYSGESFDIVSEERTIDYPSGKDMQQIDTPPFVTPREVIWADEVNAPLATVFECRRHIHTRGVQTDNAFLYRNLYHPPPPPRITGNSRLLPRATRQSEFIDPITFYYS